MKKISSLLLLLIAFIISVPAVGQGLKITGFGGYTFQDKVFGYYGDVIIRDGAHYGGMISFEKSQQLSLDLTYSRQDTEFDIIDYSSSTSNAGTYKGSVNYIMLGASHSPDFTAKIAPYGGIMLGAGIFTLKDSDVSDEWRFTVGGKLGAIFHASEKFGIVLQTQLMVPVQGVGFGVGCGGGGCGTGVSTSSTATQFGFTGGIEIKLNK